MNRTVRSLALSAAFMLPASAPETATDLPHNRAVQYSTTAIAENKTFEKTEITFEPIEDEDQGLRFALIAGGLLLFCAAGDWINKRLDNKDSQEDPPTPE